MSENRKVLFSVVASALLHGGGLFALTAWSWLQTGRRDELRVLPAPAEMVEVTLMPRPASTATVAAKPPQSVRATQPKLAPLTNRDGLAKSDQAPAEPIFDSDQNMVAASAAPASGTVPLPSQDGRVVPFTGFENRNYLLGENKPLLDTLPDEEANEADEEAAPLFRPKPLPATIANKPELPTKGASDPPKSSFKPVERDRPSSERLAVPKPAPDAALKQPLSSKPSPVADLAMKTDPKPPGAGASRKKPPRPSAYQAPNERTKIEGSISNRGQPSVDAAATPIGRYRRVIADAIGPRWHENIRKNMGLITVGSVRIKFYITNTGKIEEVKILENSSSQTFSDSSLRAVYDSKIPPLPPDVVPLLEDGRLEIEYTFTIY